MLNRFIFKTKMALAIIVCVTVTSANAQQSRSTRIFRTNNPANIQDLNPDLIQSERIEGTTQSTTALPNPHVGKINSSPLQLNGNNRSNRSSGGTIQLQSPQSKSRNNQGFRQPTANVIPVPKIAQPEKISTGGFSNRGQQKSQPSKIDTRMIEAKSTPTIQTKISAPRTINVNQTARLFVHANNVGTVDVTKLKLVAILPDHAKFVSSVPQPSGVDGKRYEFTIQSLRAGAKQDVQIDVIPTAKHPLNISTQIVIESQQQVAVAVQQPVLEVTVNGPNAIQTGQTLTHQVTVKNTGDGIAEGVRIDTHRPEQLDVVSQPQKTLVPKLVPGQVAKFQLSSFARTAGDANIVFQVSAHGAETSEGRARVRVIRPELGVQVLGPARNYLGRDGVYTIQLKNTSEIAINDVNVVLQVPGGLQINTISQEAKINQNNGTLNWNFKQMPGNGQQAIQFRAKAVAEGNQICTVRIETKETAAREMSLKTEVRSRADLSIRITDSGEPVNVGGKSDFTIEVTNHGSRNADNVMVQVELPNALMPVNQGRYTINPMGNQIAFNNVSIKAGDKHSFKFQVVAVTEGEHVVRGTVSLQGSAHSISSENSVFVFESDNAKVSEALVPEIRR